MLHALNVVKRLLTVGFGLLLASCETGFQGLNPQGEDPGFTDANGGLPSATGVGPGTAASQPPGAEAPDGDNMGQPLTPAPNPTSPAGPDGAPVPVDPTPVAPEPDTPFGSGGAAAGEPSAGAGGAAGELGTDIDAGTFGYNSPDKTDAGAPDGGTETTDGGEEL